MLTGAFSRFGGRSGRALALTVTALLLIVPAALQGQGAAVDPAASAAPPSGSPDASAPVASQPTVDKPDLRTRTRGFEPGRFNLSTDGGLGLIRVASPYTLAPGEVAGGFSVLNYDRNPGDLDFFQYSFQAAVGMPGGFELFVRGSPVFRTNAVNLDPTGYPIPPLDLFVDTYPSLALRAPPHFLFAQEAPFKSYYVDAVTIDPPGHGAFGTSSGHVLLGGKVRLGSHESFAIGARGYVEIPTESPSYNVENWRYVAGTSGQTNVGGDLLVARQFGRFEVFANGGFKYVGDPDAGLRLQLVDSSKWGTSGFLVGRAIESKLDLRNQLLFNGGFAMPAVDINGMRFWLIGELGYTRYVGGGTPVERLVHPVEMRLGVQANVPKYPRIAIGAAWQLLFNDGGDGTTRRSQFQTPDGRGDINFTTQVDWQLAQAFEAEFLAQGATFRERSSRVFATDNPDFDQWRNVSPGDTPVVAMGGGNVLAFITWRVN